MKPPLLSTRLVDKTLSTRYVSAISSSKLLAAFATFSLLVTLSTAQKTTAKCAPEWDWSNNKAKESPCVMAAKLLALCDTDPSSFTLGSEGSYVPTSQKSSGSLTPNTCSCNIVTYNLLMACQSCQKGNSPSDTPDWAEYGNSCSMCFTETGISPGPCGQQLNTGFPASVHPEKGSIAVPMWALENTSGSKWNPASAKKLAENGAEKLIEAPNLAATLGKDSSGADNKSPAKADQEGGEASSAPVSASEKNRGAVIACTVLATILLLCFGLYLLRLWHDKRKHQKMRQYGDTAFDEVVPTKKKRDSNNTSNGGGGGGTPMKLNFKNMVARLTLPMPKTPIFPRTPRTPRTPGLAEKLPSTPLTARFWTIGRRDTKKLSIIEKDDETEYLAEKMVRFDPTPGGDLRKKSMISQRSAFCQDHHTHLRAIEADGIRHSRGDSMMSNYSDYNSYKSATSQNSTPRPGSVTSVASAGSREILTTGSVKVDQPKLQEAKRVDSLRTSGGAFALTAYEPARRGSQASVASQETASSMNNSAGSQASLSDQGLSNSLTKSLPPAPRIRSQSAKVSEWNDRASVASQEPRKSTRSSKSVRTSAMKSRSASMSEVETISDRSSSVPGDSTMSEKSAKRSKSTASARYRVTSGAGSDYEGSLSDSEQRETIQFPEELQAKQREASTRFSAASSAPSTSTMDKSSGRMQDLFQTATQNLRSSVSRKQSAVDDDNDAADEQKRVSGVTVSSNSSNLRRLDSVIGQLEFDEMMSR